MTIFGWMLLFVYFFSFFLFRWLLELVDGRLQRSWNKKGRSPHSMTKIRIFHGYIRGLNNPNVLSSLLYTLYLYTWWTAQDISIGATHIPIETENVKLPKLVSFIIFCYFLFLLRRAGFFFLVYSFPFHKILFVLFYISFFLPLDGWQFPRKCPPPMFAYAHLHLFYCNHRRRIYIHIKIYQVNEI